MSVYPYRKRALNVLVRGPLQASEVVETAHGKVVAEAGDYIVIDPRNKDSWPLKQHFLAANYEPIDPNSDARFAVLRRGIHTKLSELILITLNSRDPDNTPARQQMEALLQDYGDASKAAGAEGAASQMRASYLALADEIHEMRKAAIITEAAANRMLANITMLVELFAPASDTRRAVFNYQPGTELPQ
jgi:hypothetical protein